MKDINRQSCVDGVYRDSGYHIYWSLDFVLDTCCLPG